MRIKEFVNPGSAVGVVVYGLGYGIGFFSARYFLRKEYEKRYAVELERELEETKRFYNILHKKDMLPEDMIEQALGLADDEYEFEDGLETSITIEDLEEELEALDEVVEEYQPTRTTEDAVAVVTSVFPNSKVIKKKRTTPSFDDVREITNDDVRYLSDDYTNMVLTFFRTDGILCHEDGQVIYHPEIVIGMNAFKALDEVPKDQPKVYLLSDEQNTLWMIDMEMGDYASTYIQHSAREHPIYRGPKKFRVNDE